MKSVLRVQQALGSGNNTLTPTGIGTQVTYDNRGFATAASVGSFLALRLAAAGPISAKHITITNTGRVRIRG